jgi:ABC-type sugar transport system ATPase subunit
MLEISLSIEGVSVVVPKGTHTAVVGPPACGASTLLRVIAGDLRPTAGEVRIGARVVNDLPRRRRPLLYATSDLEAPRRWSVQHLLVAAVRGRSLDREDRLHELHLAASKWHLDGLLDRRLDSLSSTERAFANLARIELLRPGVLVADRLLEHVSPAVLPSVADELYRTLRVLGTTAVVAPSSLVELGMVDALVVLDAGRVVQQGVASHVFRHPVNEAAARATGEINVVPVTIRGREVESVIGGWSVDAPPFEGAGVALARPGDFTLAQPGEESDVILAVEEASFYGGSWHVRGILTGAVMLYVELPRDAAVHKGKLLALRYEPSRFRLLATAAGGAASAG